MNKDIDILHQYRAVSDKLKKRFLKKPNIAEGSEQFGSLVKLLTAQECFQYAGFCSLARARCEHSLRNWCSEVQALIDASNCFLQSEHLTLALHCPSSQQHLLATINCCSHAIRVYVENGQPTLACCLCVRLGDILKDIGQAGESVQHYQRSFELQLQSPILSLESLQNILAVAIMNKDYEEAVDTVSLIGDLSRSCAGSVSDSQNVSSAYANILANCEITRVLLLLLLQPTQQNVKMKYSRILEKYSWHAKDEEITSSYLSEDLFLLMQSLVMSCQADDRESIECLQRELWKQLSPQQNHLLHLILNNDMSSSTCDNM